MQITVDSGKIVTREVFLDGPYGLTLSHPKSIYVMPLEKFGASWLTRPNGTLDPLTLAPAFPSGPGFAFGYGLTDGIDQSFAAESVISMHFEESLLTWNGSGLVDAGAVEIKAFRGSDPMISTPEANFAISGDSLDMLSLAPIASRYGSGGVEAHGSVRFAILGDGVSPASDLPNGVYVATMQLTSSQPGLSASDPYRFVLHKNATADALLSAVGALGVDNSMVQYVPEPLPHAMLMPVLLIAIRLRRRSRSAVLTP